MPNLLRSITLAALALASGMAAAHDGQLDTEECHRDVGGYHCHRVGETRPAPVRHVAPGKFGTLPDDAPGGAANRRCTAASFACRFIETPVHGAAPSSATHGTGEEDHGMKALEDIGLPVLVGLFVLALYAMRGRYGLQGRRSQHGN